MSVLIVGYGVVGQNLEKELRVLKPDCIDKYKELKHYDYAARYDLIFICVPTPYTKDNPCDDTEVWNAIKENERFIDDDTVVVIKSTILPGTTDRIRETIKNRVVFSPEYYGGTQHCNNFDFNFTILGGERKDCNKVIQILQGAYDARHTFRVTDSKTAELVKYMENSYLAMKVSFCTQFYEIAKNKGIDYEELRELFILDPRVNPSHTFVYRDHPYWNSHCLNKDVPAIAETENAELLKAVIEFNEKMKEQ